MSEENQVSACPVCASACDHLHAAADKVAKRDWAGFFQALANFAVTILPVVLPLFMKDGETK